MANPQVILSITTFTDANGNAMKNFTRRVATPGVNEENMVTRRGLTRKEAFSLFRVVNCGWRGTDAQIPHSSGDWGARVMPLQNKLDLQREQETA